MRTRALGSSSLRVTVLGQGGAPLGDLYQKISDVQALGALAFAHKKGINFFDTSPWYGVGLSEARFGLALHRLPRDSFAVQTKVGRFLVPDAQARNGTAVGWLGGYHFGIRFDYSAEAIERQMQDSLQRMGLGRVDSVVIHDLEPTPHREPSSDGVDIATRHLEQLRASGFAALQKLRADGVIQAFGAGVNSDEDGEDVAVKKEWNIHYVRSLLEMPKQIGGGERGIDFLLCANMFSLLNHDAHESGILDACLAAGVSVIVGGPYSSGILASGPDPPSGQTPYYNYQPASNEVRARCRRVEAVCKAHGVPLIAAALQFPLTHPAVSCVIPGSKSDDEVASNVTLMGFPIPPSLWTELRDEGLCPASLPPPFLD